MLWPENCASTDDLSTEGVVRNCLRRSSVVSDWSNLSSRFVIHVAAAMPSSRSSYIFAVQLRRVLHFYFFVDLLQGCVVVLDSRENFYEQGKVWIFMVWFKTIMHGIFAG
ncbi:hypothetical protein RYX36_035590 [Vicia faba]